MITTKQTATHLTKAEAWSSELKENAQDMLEGQNLIDWIPAPDGDEFVIPSIGDATVRPYVENQEVVFDSLDTGQYRFSGSEYKSSAMYITKKARQDASYAARLEAGFVPKMTRAFEEVLETNIMSLVDATGSSVGKHVQADDANTINGADHRWACEGTSLGSTGAIRVVDFAKALYAFKRANIADVNLIAIVDPSVELAFNADLALAGSGFNSNSARWEPLMENGGIASGTRFVRNFYGFDIYTSNYLSEIQTGANIGTAGWKNNFLFSAQGGDLDPFKGAWHQPLEVESDYNMHKQREEYVTTGRYVLDLYRPENLVVLISDPDVSGV